MHQIGSTGLKTGGTVLAGFSGTAFPKVVKHLVKFVEGRCLEYNRMSSYKVRHMFNIDIIEN